MLSSESRCAERTHQNTTPEQTLGLHEALSKIGAGDLTQQSFTALAEAVYADKEGPDQLRKLLEDWGNVSASKTNAGVLRGYCYYILGDLTEAEATLKGQKRSQWSYYYLIRTYWNLKNPDEAVKLVEEAHRKFPDSLLLGYLLVELLAKSGRGEEVLNLLEDLGKLDGTSSDYAFYRGRYEESQGEYRTAIDLYREATSRDDKNVEAYFRLGYLLDLYGREDEYLNDEAVVAYESEGGSGARQRHDQSRPSLRRSRTLPRRHQMLRGSPQGTFRPHPCQALSRGRRGGHEDVLRQGRGGEGA